MGRWRSNPVPRSRRNDPLGVSDNPNFVTDPVRLAELVAELKRRLAYLSTSYRLCKSSAPDHITFNQSLARLKKAVGRPKVPSRPESRLDPRLELLISNRARKLAGLDPAQLLGPEHGAFVQQAGIEVAQNTRAMRGRPADYCLRHHVEGLMALMQEGCGKPVRALRDKNSVYDPQLPDEISRTFGMVFSAIDPDVTETQLVNIIRSARRKYAGKPMRFRDFFPFYGGTVDEQTMIPTPGPHHRLKQFEIVTPIYCP
jgi:hypothetical protein